MSERRIPVTIKDFPGLVRWLAKAHHEGAVMHVGSAVGISPSTADKWARGVATPSIEFLVKLCAAYPELDVHRVMDLVLATKPAAPRRGMAKALMLTAALMASTLGASARADGGPLPLGAALPGKAHYVKRRRRGALRVGSRAQSLATRRAA